MSLVIQTVIIAIVALLLRFISSAVAQWTIWLAYAFFAATLFLKGIKEDKTLKAGGIGDISAAKALPPAMTLVAIVLVIFLFIDVNKFHLLWITPLLTLLVELPMGFLWTRRAEKHLFDKHKKTESDG